MEERAGERVAFGRGETGGDREWSRATPEKAGLDALQLRRAAAYAGGSGMVVRAGRPAFAWGESAALHHIQSATKSIGAIALGLAIAEEKIRLDDPAVRHHPSLGVPPEANRETGWLERITLRHLATMTAGFAKDGGHTGLLFPPGSHWAYSDGGANWLGECLTLALRCDLAALLAARVFRPLGIRPEALTWRENAHRPALIQGIARREIGAGIFASADALARIGQLFLAGGRWGQAQILPAGYVEEVRATAAGQARLPVTQDPLERFGGASAHYGLLWWNNGDGTIGGVPRDAYWAWGLGDAIILVIPSLGLCASRVGTPFPGERKPSYYQVLEPFFAPIAGAAGFQDE